MSSYYKPKPEHDNTRSVNIVGRRGVKNERKPVNNTERVTPPKPIPQPIKKANPLADHLSIDLDKTPIGNWINYNLKVNDGKYGGAKAVTASEQKVANAVEANAYKYESATDRIQEQDRQKKAPKMSASRSWQIIKQSMGKDELADWYKEHPEDKPVELMPVKFDPYLTEELGEDWYG